MSKTFDVSDFNVKELNDAIDKTNFPSTATANGNGVANGSTKAGATKSEDRGKNGEAVEVVENADPSEQLATPNGVLKKRDITPLQMKQYSGEVFDVPGTPKTPRTSTTPGTQRERQCSDFRFFLCFFFQNLIVIDLSGQT
jgi:hypothetical protein